MQNVCFLSENKKNKLANCSRYVSAWQVRRCRHHTMSNTVALASINTFICLHFLHVFWNSSSKKITEAELRADALGIFPRWTITRVRCQKNRLLGLTHIQAAKWHGLAWMAWLMVSHSRFCKMAWNSKTLQSGIHVSFCNIKSKAVEQACHFY